MNIEEFMLERYLTKYQPYAKYIMGASDCETFALNEILSEKELSDMHSLRLSYSESQGNILLREEVADLHQTITPDQVVITIPQEGIFLTMNALLDQGDKVIVQVPCYQSNCAIPQALGSKVITWAPEDLQNQWRWNINFLKENLDKKTKLVVLNTPHNPTGSLFTKEEYTQVISLAKENGTYLLSDEMYRMMEYQKNDRLPIGSDIYEKGISLSGLSKTFGLGGLRIGWLSTKDKALLNKIVRLKDYTSLSNSSLSEFVALAALRKKDRILERNLGIVKKNLVLLDKFFNRNKEKFSWIRPDAGPVAFVKTKFETRVDSFCEKLVKVKGVLLTPGSKFSWGQNYFRLGFGRKNLAEGLALLEEFLTENII